MQKKPTVSLYLDTRRVLESGKSPLTIRVTFTKFIGTKKVWDQRYFPTGLHFTEEAFKKLTTGKHKNAHSEIKDKIRELENKAYDIVSTNPYVTPELFKVLFTGEYTIAGNLSQLFREKISDLNKAGQFASASVYDSASKSFEAFSPSTNLHAIDEAWLKRYEHWMKHEGWRKKKDGEKGNSITTVGLYLRNLRHIFNIAIARRILSRDQYPFGAGKYTIPQSNNFKKALTKNDKTKFVNYKGANEKEKRAHAHWCFSYYCNGMNFSDMAYLCGDNISGGIMVYLRKKTSTTDRTQTPLAVPLRKEAIDIIKKYGTNNPFLFGIITGQESKAKQRLMIQDWIKKTNATLSKIASKLKMPFKITTYTARHTVATTLLESGADLRDIKETFGHSTFSTTERYVASLDIAKKKKLVDML
ncbi:MAG: site-specific integrase [Cyclobacteriaceae bacterium]